MPRQCTLTGLDEFDRFWAAYPKKIAKKAAQKAWAQLQPDASLTTRMIEALGWQRHQPQWVKDGGAFIPHPASWIRAERWEDEPFHTDPAPDDAFLAQLEAVERGERRHS